MANRTDQLLSGSYKSVPFFTRTETLDSLGQKRVVHDYPNSSFRYVEPQGRVPLDITIDIFFSGENFLEDFLSMRRAMEEPAPGRLILPTFGIFENIAALPSNAQASQQSVGEITMSVKFTETIERPSPTDVVITDQEVARRATTTRAALSETFTAEYLEPESLPNVQTAQLDVLTLGNRIGEITGRLRDAQRFARNIAGRVRNVARIVDLIFSQDAPLGYLETIAGTVTGLEVFGTIFELSRVGDDLSTSLASISQNINPERPTTIPQEPQTTTLNPVPLFETDTLDRRERNQTRLVMANSFRVFGMIEMFESAALRSYTTTDQIDEITSLLNEQYIALVEDDTTDVVIPGIKTDLDILKGITEETLQAKRQNAYAVIEIDIEKNMPTTLLAYELYGERIRNQAQLDFFSGLLAGLNAQQPAYRLRGTVRVVEVG